MIRRLTCIAATIISRFSLLARLEPTDDILAAMNRSQEVTRYSPAAIINIEKLPTFGNPGEDKISTSRASGST
jgi:hypothetical protein